MARNPTVTAGHDSHALTLAEGLLTATIVIDASPGAVEAAQRAAIGAFRDAVAALGSEDAALRMPADPLSTELRGSVARRMWRAVRPFAGLHPLAPIVARDGALAEEILGAVSSAAVLDRAIVSVGGCVALQLTPGFGFRTPVSDDADDGTAVAIEVRSSQMVRGIGVAGRPEIRPSLGIGDTVTVLAQTAAKAAAAASVIADAIDLPGHPSITRVPANLLDPSSPLGGMPLVRNVGRLSEEDLNAALEAGRARASSAVANGHIVGAVLALRGVAVSVGATGTVCGADRSDDRMAGRGRA